MTQPKKKKSQLHNMYSFDEEFTKVMKIKKQAL